MHAIMMDFSIGGRLARPRGPFRAQGSALTRNVERSHGSKNLLQRGILYRHEKILLRQGRLHAQTERKQCGEIGWFFIDISGCLCSFGLALCVVREPGVVLQWIAAGSAGESMGERLGKLKVTGMHVIMMDSSIWGHLTRPRGPFRAQGSALTRNVERSHGSKNLLQRGILYRHEKI